MSKDALGLLVQYAWPGNVRELENVMERAAVLCQGPELTESDLPEVIRIHEGSSEAMAFPVGTPLVEVERRLIR